jgi:hypothetical protein
MNLKIFAFVLLIIVSSRLLAQNNDFGLWIDAAAKKKIASTDLILCSEFYTHNDNRSIDRVSIGMEGGRNLFSTVNISAGYLMMNNNKTDHYELSHRMHTSAKFNCKISKLTFSFRQRLQVTRYPEKVLGSSKYLNYWRNRIRVSYIIAESRTQPVIGIETFVLLNRFVSDRLDEVRYNLSAIYQLSSSTELEFYGLLSKTSDLNQYIFGIAYQIKI